MAWQTGRPYGRRRPADGDICPHEIRREAKEGLEKAKDAVTGKGGGAIDNAADNVKDILPGN